jgi:V/A-type H+-transporting ATPase subunit G/H
MTRVEILSEIKRAEDDAKALVSRAMESKNQKVTESKVLSKDIISTAEEEALAYADSELKAAREEIKKEKDQVINNGKIQAQAAKVKASKNSGKAVKFMLSEFERAANA